MKKLLISLTLLISTSFAIANSNFVGLSTKFNNNNLIISIKNLTNQDIKLQSFTFNNGCWQNSNNLPTTQPSKVTTILITKDSLEKCKLNQHNELSLNNIVYNNNIGFNSKLKNGTSYTKTIPISYTFITENNVKQNNLDQLQFIYQ